MAKKPTKSKAKTGALKKSSTPAKGAKTKRPATKPARAAKPAKAVRAVKPAKAARPVKAAKPAKAAPRARRERFEDAPDYRPEIEAKTGVGIKNGAFLKVQRQRLLELRDHILDQMQDVAQGNLRSAPEGGGGSAFGQHMGDAGSDAYEKDFALSLLSQEQDSLYEIEEALKRIDQGTYGVCEMSGKPIPRPRLEALPWARFTVECQEQVEKANKGRNRWSSTPQFMDASEGGDEDEEESDEEDSSKTRASKE
jgi:RNA polymerase-binding transcription factor DksA